MNNYDNLLIKDDFFQKVVPAGQLMNLQLFLLNNYQELFFKDDFFQRVVPAGQLLNLLIPLMMLLVNNKKTNFRE